MFVQGKTPAITAPWRRVEPLRAALRRAGYTPHTGHRYQRDGEIGAWTAPLPAGRHVHVQEVRDGSRVLLFAHTEPATGWAHVWSALSDGANFSAGSRKLRADLRAAGWR